MRLSRTRAWVVTSLFAWCAACGAPQPKSLERPAPCAGADCQGPPYPRIASYRIETTFDAQAQRMLERVQLAIVDAEAHALHPEVLPRIRSRQPALELLAYLTSEELPRDPDASEHPLADARFTQIAPAFWLTEPGSRLRTETGPTASELSVEDGSAFSVTRPKSDFYPEDEPTYLLLGDEHVRLVQVRGNTLVVERGFRSTPKAHPPGTPIAAHVVFFSGTWMLNLADNAPADPVRGRYRDLLAQEASKLVRKGPWTGIFLDVCFSDIGFLNGGLLDVDRDGRADEARQASEQWSKGFGRLVSALRARLGPEVPLVANPGAQDCPHAELDGILLEGFPVGLPPGFLAFERGLARYLAWSTRPGRRALSVVNAFSPNIGFGVIRPGQDEAARIDYASMRLGLAVALLGDGYASYDNGVFGHYVAWWYDEYDGAGRGTGFLGYPIAGPERHASGAWSRRFQHGMAIANPTEKAVVVSVPRGYVKLQGKQDPLHNDGRPVRGALRVAPKDGYLLLQRR